RQRMIDDMTLRGFGQDTQRHYITAVRRCTEHVRKPPGALGAEDARAFLLHLQARGASVGSVNRHSVALRFFLRVTLGRTEHLERIPILHEAKRLGISRSDSSFFNCLVTSNPEISGSWMSMMMRSGRCSLTMLKTMPPSLACKTRYPCDSSTSLKSFMLSAL